MAEDPKDRVDRFIPEMIHTIAPTRRKRNIQN